MQINQRIGGITNYYELTDNAHLSQFLDQNPANDIFIGIRSEAAMIILADLINAKQIR